MCALQESLPDKATRTNGNLTLIYVVSPSKRIAFYPQQIVNTLLLVDGQYLMKNVIDGIVDTNCTY